MNSNIYAEKALAQLPRLLTLLDRNPFSPTYGCFHRDYWMYKTSDFPDAVRQFGTHALALVYTCEFPNNIYFRQPKIKDWTIAAMNYWAGIQHRDGSFDEFYPYERGWVGPTAFTTFAIAASFQLLRDEVDAESARKIFVAVERGARFIIDGEQEEDHLANHHAMACLAVWKAYEILQDPQLKQGYEKLWKTFCSYHNFEEGWSREYDGADPGYLSATISFLAKIYKSNRDPRILNVLRGSIEFCSYFVYPNGFYAGSTGSRNTLHFYPDGFEILSTEIPLASAVAKKLMQALTEGKLVPPENMSDRYVFYRVPEFLEAYSDSSEQNSEVSRLPFERQPFAQHFSNAGISIINSSNYYVVSNLAKGGVVKIFDHHSGELLLNDCGIIGRLHDGSVVTSQWIDPAYQISFNQEDWEIRGQLNRVPTFKYFNLFTGLLFRGSLLTFGWSSGFSHYLKRRIRKAMMLGHRPVPLYFRRFLQIKEDEISLGTEIWLDHGVRVSQIAVGDEFFVRYVPQSRFFQSQELEVKASYLTADQIKALNSGERVTIIETVSSEATEQKMNHRNHDHPEGVYDVDYYHGRKKKRQLIYRLRRRTEEVEAAIRHHLKSPIGLLVDVGTADGMMLRELKPRTNAEQVLGLDYSLELLRAEKLPGVLKAQGDALHLPIKSGIADAVIATAIIEHVPDPDLMMRECGRVLRPGGLLVITTPAPLMERVSSAIGLLKESGHHLTMNLKQLQKMAQANGFRVVEARKFMFSPIGFPAEKLIERIFGPIGLNLVMANQLLVARWESA